VVSASRSRQIGVASTASEGVASQDELALIPIYRVGQLLETVPGLVVTSHSGEGKANQYLMRGMNLDHGTDLATFIAGMPVNMRTHAHGQGYTDLNFFIPELAGGLVFAKGPYYASEGDFSSAGAIYIRLPDRIRDQLALSAGTLGERRLFTGGTRDLAQGRLLAAVELSKLDGPWTHPDDARKVNAVLHYSAGSASDGFSLTAMAYRGRWNATTDQPERAVSAQLIDRYGTLDPSDGGKAERFSLSGNYAKAWGRWRLSASAYAIRSQLMLWNNFTHFLDDPQAGDQRGQQESRAVAGGALSARRGVELLGVATELEFGTQTRYDVNRLNLQHTALRRLLSLERDNHIKEASVAAYGSARTDWTPWLRSVVGLREDFLFARDNDRLHPDLSGAEHARLLQPKASLVLAPYSDTEFYLSAGRGFHSNDVRSGAADDGSHVRPPMLAQSRGAEIGMQSAPLPGFDVSVVLFRMDFDSDLSYNADAGATEAGRPSSRRGIDLSAAYRPWRWLKLSAQFSRARARYTDADPAGSDVEDAPEHVAALGAQYERGPWSGGLVFRQLGAHPLVSDNSIRARGYAEWNVDAAYQIGRGLALRLDIFNLLNQRAAAASYYYTSRLQGEAAAGVAGIHSHPLEPRSARITLTRTF
jgi:hypothetical protein